MQDWLGCGAQVGRKPRGLLLPIANCTLIWVILGSRNVKNLVFRFDSFGGFMNEPKVDVLAVMDEAARHADGGSAPLNGDAIRQARAAVAEMIEAAKRANETLGHAYHTVLSGEIAENAHEDYQRLDAALARIGG